MSHAATNPVAAFRAVSASVEAIKNDAHETIEAMEAGDVVRQGDLYLVALDEAPDRQADYDGRQLAPGDTQGSRHLVEGDCAVYTAVEAHATAILNRLVPATKGQQLFLGPVVQAAPGAAPVFTHPEHGDRTLPAGGCFLVVYQRAHADEIRRQTD